VSAPGKNSEADLPLNSDNADASADGAGLGSVLNEHKGKLAIGVAATLGLMVFYSWREKKLAQEDPEAHALHLRSKAIVRAAESDAAQPKAPEGAPLAGKTASSKDRLAR
jgi:hypothetical protein